MIAPDPASLPIRAQILGVQAGVEARLRASETVIQAARAPAPALPWQPGERLQARVEASLPGGRFLMRIAEFSFDIQLPAPTRVGDQLALTYAGSTPRPQFVLAQDDSPGDRATRLDLSREGRALAAALATRVQQPAEPAAQRAGPALLPTPEALLQPGMDGSAALVSALRTALDSSGLFYESHLAEWVEGRRPLDRVLNEPQARLRPSTQPEADGAQAHRTAPAERIDEPAARSAPTAAGWAASRSPDPEQALVHPQALPLVREQLQTLENGQLVWVGQAWPGQALEWHLHIVDDGGPRAAEEPLPWATQLRLTLPRLGSVVADLQLTGNSLRLELAATDPTAGSELRAARNVLANALADAGLQLVRFATIPGEKAEHGPGTQNGARRDG